MDYTIIYKKEYVIDVCFAYCVSYSLYGECLTKFPSPSVAQLIGPACYTVTDWLSLRPVSQSKTGTIDSVEMLSHKLIEMVGFSHFKFETIRFNCASCNVTNVSWRSNGNSFSNVPNLNEFGVQSARFLFVLPNLDLLFLTQRPQLTVHLLRFHN